MDVARFGLRGCRHPVRPSRMTQERDKVLTGDPTRNPAAGSINRSNLQSDHHVSTHERGQVHTLGAYYRCLPWSRPDGAAGTEAARHGSTSERDQVQLEQLLSAHRAATGLLLTVTMSSPMRPNS